MQLILCNWMQDLNIGSAHGAASSIPSDGNNTGLALWVHQPL